MATLEEIAIISYQGLYKYVPNRNKKKFRDEFVGKKRYTSKFLLAVFPKYIDFEKWSKNPKNEYDIILINYWLIEVPNVGLKRTQLFNSYNGANKIINKRIKDKESKKKKENNKRLKKPAKIKVLKKNHLPIKEKKEFESEDLSKTMQQMGEEAIRNAKEFSRMKLEREAEKEKLSNQLLRSKVFEKSIDENKEVLKKTIPNQMGIKDDNSKINRLKLVIKIFLITLFIGCFLDMAFSYYEIVRYSAFISFCYLCYLGIDDKEEFYISKIWGFSAILINPIFKLTITKDFWLIIDSIWILLLVYSLFENRLKQLFKKKRNQRIM
jgi:hypothetical protein